MLLFLLSVLFLITPFPYFYVLFMFYVVGEKGFSSNIEELPPTSDMKMIDIWLIFCLVVPFLAVILRTAIECINCNCLICESKEANKAKDEKDDNKKEGDAIQGASSGEVTRVWVGTGAKVTPQQVEN